MHPQGNNQTAPPVQAVSDTISFHSPLSASDVLDALDASVIKTRQQRNQMSSVHSIGGRVTQDRFALTKFSSFRNGFARNLHGIVRPLDDGSIVEYRFELSMIIRIMFSLWFVLLLILLGQGLMTLFSGNTRLELIFGPIIMLAGAVFTFSYAMTRSRADELEMERFLRNVATMPADSQRQAHR